MTGRAGGEIARLEEELSEIEVEAQRVREEPLPTVPPARRGTLTPLMMHNQRLGGVADRARAVGKEIQARRSLLAQIEAGGP